MTPEHTGGSVGRRAGALSLGGDFVATVALSSSVASTLALRPIAGS